MARTCAQQHTPPWTSAALVPCRHALHVCAHVESVVCPGRALRVACTSVEARPFHEQRELAKRAWRPSYQVSSQHPPLAVNDFN